MYQTFTIKTPYADQQVVIRTEDGAHISTDPDHRDWIAYQEWLAAGNTPTEWTRE